MFILQEYHIDIKGGRMNLNEKLKQKRDLRHRRRRKHKNKSDNLPEVDSATEQVKQLIKAEKLLTGRLKQIKEEKKKLELLIKKRG
jgi:vacuolar-type H+-ATPase subunit I/STV1